MNYQGNIALGDTIDIKFTTCNTSGVPTTLAGTPAVAAYVDNSTTEITAGVTLTVDFDARTGLHNVRVVASGGNGFAASTNVNLVITTGTVGGNSVVGYVIGSFAIEKRVDNVIKWAGTATTTGDIAIKTTLAKTTHITGFNDISTANVQTELGTYGALKPTTAGRTLDVTTTGEAGLDFANTAGTIPDSAGVTTLLGRVTSTLFTGITSLKEWLGLLAGKQAGNSTARTEIRSTGAGSGTYDETTDSAEAIRDRGDAAWTTGAGGDPWGTALPGAYGAGTAGNILGNRLDASVSTRATPAQVQTELTTYGAAKPGNAMTLTAAYDASKTASTQASVDAVASYVDTEVAAIKSQTDKLQFTGTDVKVTLDGEQVALTVSALSDVADAILKRDWTGVSGEAAYSLLNAARMLRNVWNTTGGTLSVKKEDGSTDAWTRTLAVDPTAQPIVGAS